MKRRVNICTQRIINFLLSEKYPFEFDGEFVSFENDEYIILKFKKTNPDIHFLFEEEMPRYKHECKQCIFLGCKEQYDLYFCSVGVEGETVIARYGNKGYEYLSGMAFSINEPLKTAKELAIERGLIKK